MNAMNRYRFVCTLSFGDIYGQVIVWLLVIFASLAAALATMSTNPIIALAAVGLILVLSLPFLLFAFVTTLFSHLEIYALDPATQSKARPAGARPAPTQATGAA